MNCPSRETLTALALGITPADAHAAQHVAKCDECSVEIRRLSLAATVLRVLEEREAESPDCLDDAVLALMATHGLAAADQAASDHLASCSRCRSQLAGVLAALESTEIANEVSRLETPSWWRRPALLRRAAGIAAVIVGVFLLPLLFRAAPTQRATRDREPSITMAAPPSLVVPSGFAVSGTAMVWTSVPGAERYAVTIFERDGTVVFEHETNDTTARLPAAVNRTDMTYFWKVAAHLGYDRTVESELMSFRLTTSSN